MMSEYFTYISTTTYHFEIYHYSILNPQIFTGEKQKQSVKICVICG